MAWQPIKPIKSSLLWLMPFLPSWVSVLFIFYHKRCFFRLFFLLLFCQFGNLKIKHQTVYVYVFPFIQIEFFERRNIGNTYIYFVIFSSSIRCWLLLTESFAGGWGCGEVEMMSLSWNDCLVCFTCSDALSGWTTFVCFLPFSMKPCHNLINSSVWRPKLLAAQLQRGRTYMTKTYLSYTFLQLILYSGWLFPCLMLDVLMLT